MQERAAKGADRRGQTRGSNSTLVMVVSSEVRFVD
jgi:hypothetical protein